MNALSFELTTFGEPVFLVALIALIAAALLQDHRHRLAEVGVVFD